MPPEVISLRLSGRNCSRVWGREGLCEGSLRLVYLNRGRMDLFLAGQPFVLESGRLAVSRPWQPAGDCNRQSNSCDLSFLALDVGAHRSWQPWTWPSWLLLAPADLRRLASLLRHNQQPVWCGNGAIGCCFTELEDLLRAPGSSGVESGIRLCVNKVLIALLQLMHNNWLNTSRPPLRQSRRSGRNLR